MKPRFPPDTGMKERLTLGAIPKDVCRLQTNGQFYETWHGREASSLLEGVARPLLYLYLTQDYIVVAL